MARRTGTPSEELLQAYHDGELGFLARRRVERAVQRSPEAQATLRSLALVRESEARTPEPDLWAGIARALPTEPPAAEPRAPGRWAEAAAWLLRPAGALTAAAAATVVLVFALSGGEPAGMADVVQYLDPGDNSVMLLQGEDEATIIWVMEPAPSETSSKESRAFI